MHQTYLLMELWEYLKIVMLLLPYNKTFAYDEHYGWLCEPINLSGKHKGVVDKKKKKSIREFQEVLSSYALLDLPYHSVYSLGKTIKETDFPFFFFFF